MCNQVKTEWQKLVTRSWLKSEPQAHARSWKEERESTGKSIARRRRRRRHRVATRCQRPPSPCSRPTLSPLGPRRGGWRRKGEAPPPPGAVAAWATARRLDPSVGAPAASPPGRSAAVEGRLCATDGRRGGGEGGCGRGRKRRRQWGSPPYAAEPPWSWERFGKVRSQRWKLAVEIGETRFSLKVGPTWNKKFGGGSHVKLCTHCREGSLVLLSPTWTV